jgi:FkbM family methyltransferase
MKHFIDLGTHKFEGLNEFTQKLNIDKNWNVYCYEPNVDIFNVSVKVKDQITSKYKTLEHYNVAVSDNNGVIIFNKHKGAWFFNKDDKKYVSEYTTGSNMLDINPQLDYGNGAIFHIEKEEVKCVDINDIIENIVRNDSNAEIYIKCDTEGSEFKILPRILKSDFLKNIKEMYIEWHERFWYNTNEYNSKIIEKHNLLESLKNIGIVCYTHT